MKPVLTRLYRPLDSLAIFETACQSSSSTAPTRYAIRQALDQEYQKNLLRQRANARQAKYKIGGGLGSEVDIGVGGKESGSIEEDGVKMKPAVVKRDFFGRIIDVALPTARGQGESEEPRKSQLGEKGKVWVSYHEGFSNAVRKPITLDELMRGF